MTSTFSARIITCLAILPLALSMGACSSSFGGQDKDDTNNSPLTQSASSSPENSEDTNSTTKNGANSKYTSAIDGSQVVGTWEGKINDNSYRIDINAVVVHNGTTTLTFTITNTGLAEISSFSSDFGNFPSDIVSDNTRLVDLENHLIYDPGKTDDGRCLCSRFTGAKLKADESIQLFTTYKELPESTTSIAVSFTNVPAPIENIPVTRK